jgi:hypothetical protein
LIRGRVKVAPEFVWQVREAMGIRLVALIGFFGGQHVAGLTCGLWRIGEHFDRYVVDLIVGVPVLVVKRQGAGKLGKNDWLRELRKNICDDG